VKDHLDVKENDEHALDFALHLSLLSCTAHAFFPEHYIFIARVSVILFPLFAQNLMLFLCRIHRESKTPNKRT
jgi:hypothetical protein